MLNAVSTEDKSYFEERIEAFKNKAREFMIAFNSLLDMESQANLNPVLKREWEELSQRGFSLKNKVNWITAKIDAAVNWFKSSFGEYDLTESNEMGILPAVALVPIAVIAGSIALLTKFISDVYIFNKKVSETKRLLDRGVSPAQVVKIIEASTPKPLLSNIAPIVKWVVIGGILYFGWTEYNKRG